METAAVGAEGLVKGNRERELPFRVGDRVRQAAHSSVEGGPKGTVRKIRVETVKPTVRSTGEEPPGITVSVLWDNGTTSHFVPDGLVKV